MIEAMANAWLAVPLVLALALSAFCWIIVCVAVWIVSLGMAQDEGRKWLALFLFIVGVPFGIFSAPFSMIFLLRKQRYRRVQWIGKFLLGALVMLLIAGALWFAIKLNS